MQDLSVLEEIQATYGPTSKLAAAVGEPTIHVGPITEGLRAAEGVVGTLAEYVETTVPPTGGPFQSPNDDLAAAVAAAADALRGDYGDLEARVLTANAYAGFFPADPSPVAAILTSDVAIGERLRALADELAPLVPNPDPVQNNARWQTAIDAVAAAASDIASLAPAGAARADSVSSALYKAGIRKAMEGFL